MSARASAAAVCTTIIEKVRKRPEIWQFTHPLYKKRVVHQRFWKDLAAELGVNDKVLKKRWKNLKDQYRKELKRVIETGEEETVVWQYFKPLNFYREQVMHRNMERAVAAAIDADDDDSEENSGEDENEGEEERPSRILNKVRGIKKKKENFIKLDTIVKQLNQMKSLLQTKVKELETSNNDADYMFLVSLLPTMKRLTEVQKLQLRGKINDWLLKTISVKDCEKDSDDDLPVIEIIK